MDCATHCCPGVPPFRALELASQSVSQSRPMFDNRAHSLRPRLTVDQHGPVARDGGRPLVAYQNLRLLFGVVPVPQLLYGPLRPRTRAAGRGRGPPRPLQYHDLGDRPLYHVRLSHDGAPRRHQSQQLVSVQLVNIELRRTKIMRSSDFPTFLTLT